MTTKLHLVAEADKPRLTNVLNEYLKIHCSHQDVPLGPESVDDYIYYAEYWREEGRYPYFITHDSELVGFVLVRTVFETDGPFYQVSDFYILPEYEGRGHGKGAVAELWSLYPGKWELDTHVNNKRACFFWASCIKRYGNGSYDVTGYTCEDGPRLKHIFEVTESG